MIESQGIRTDTSSVKVRPRSTLTQFGLFKSKNTFDSWVRLAEHELKFPLRPPIRSPAQDETKYLPICVGPSPQLLCGPEPGHDNLV